MRVHCATILPKPDRPGLDARLTQVSAILLVSTTYVILRKITSAIRDQSENREHKFTLRKHENGIIVICDVTLVYSLLCRGLIKQHIIL